MLNWHISSFKWRFLQLEKRYSKHFCRFVNSFSRSFRNDATNHTLEEEKNWPHKGAPKTFRGISARPFFRFFLESRYFCYFDYPRLINCNFFKNLYCLMYSIHTTLFHPLRTRFIGNATFLFCLTTVVPKYSYPFVFCLWRTQTPYIF